MFQLNLLSLTSHYGDYAQKTSSKLLQEGFFDFVGTDTHRLEHLDVLKKIGTKKMLKLIPPLLENTKSTFSV